jgi:Eukaryotic aspartyl protease
VSVQLDTGSSDLWVASDACKTAVCKKTNMPLYPSANIKLAGGSVNLLYGDSLTGTHASGPVAQDVAVVAGLSMSQQPFAAISDTNNTSVMQGANGIFGLGFPGGRCVLRQSLSSRDTDIVLVKYKPPSSTRRCVSTFNSKRRTLVEVKLGLVQYPVNYG